MKIFITTAFLTTIASQLTTLTDASSEASSGSSFVYVAADVHGPSHWADLEDINPNYCGGDKQSPIDIETRPVGSSGCTQYQDYKFMVRVCSVMLNQLVMEFVIECH